MKYRFFKHPVKGTRVKAYDNGCVGNCNKERITAEIIDTGKEKRFPNFAACEDYLINERGYIKDSTTKVYQVRRA